MQSSKFLIEFKRFNASAVVTYNTNGVLVELVFDPGIITDDALSFFYKNIPFFDAHIEHYRKFPNVKVLALVETLDFQTFWSAFANKVGNKQRSQKLWDNLKPPEQAKAMAYIKQYDQWLLQQRGIAKLYPETYLQQQRWNN